MRLEARGAAHDWLAKSDFLRATRNRINPDIDNTAIGIDAEIVSPDSFLGAAVWRGGSWATVHPPLNVVLNSQPRKKFAQNSPNGKIDQRGPATDRVDRARPWRSGDWNSRIHAGTGRNLTSGTLRNT
jgi:hypothetical protein